MTVRDLRNKRAGLIVQAQTILDVADQEKRSLIDEERGRYDALVDEIQLLNADIKRDERFDSLKADAQPDGQRNGANPMAEIGMTDKEIKRYSFVRAIRAGAASARGEHTAWNDAGLEREASEAVAKRFNREPRTFFVPNDVLVGTREQRDLTVGTPTSGGYLVQTQYLPMIRLLRNKLILAQAGITMLTGLTGDIAIPKQTAGGTGYWVGESGAPPKSGQTFGQVTMRPHTFGAYVDLSHKLLNQSSIDIEQFVQDDLTRVIALGIDLAGLHGNSGVDANQPDGLAVASGIGSVVGGANGAIPAWGNIVDLETAVANANADVNNMSYVTNTKVRGQLKKTFRNATYGETPIWEDGQLNGNRALASNQVKSTLDKGTSTGACSAIFFGNWADLVLGIWGDGLDILVDPFSLSTQKGVRVVAFQDVDYAVRLAASFSAMLDALTA